MTTPRRVLFAVKDPDGRHRAVFDKAIRVAKALGADLEFFNAVSTPVFLEVTPLRGHSVAEIKRETLAIRRGQIDKLVARAKKLGVAATGSVEWDYPPHEAIVRRARRIRAGLIIAQCHEGRRLAPWLVHLNDWELLRESPVPVLLLKSARAWQRPTILAAVDPSHAHAKPSGLDMSIVGEARAYARKLGGKLALMHANYPQVFSIAAGDPALDPATMAITYEAQKERDRRDFERFAKRANVPESQRYLVDGSPDDAIPAIARKTRASFVVMGALSRSGLKRVFIGNTAERVLQSLPCDVLVVKPKRAARAIARNVRGMQIVAPAPIVPLPM